MAVVDSTTWLCTAVEDFGTGTGFDPGSGSLACGDVRNAALPWYNRPTVDRMLDGALVV